MNVDVLVVGAGPAGMAAAVRAREGGARVTVLDDNPTPGGQIWRAIPDTYWLRKFRAAKIPCLTGARVISGNPGSHTVLLETLEGAFEIGFRSLILCTGARELFLPFPGWTLPGVMGVGGMQALAKSGLPIAGKDVIIAGSGPLLLAVAAYFRKHGARVKLIAEQARRRDVLRFALELGRSPEKIWQALSLQFSLLGVPYLHGCYIEAAEGAGRLERVRLRRRDKTWTERCDYAAVAYGLCPNTELATLFGCQIARQAVVVDELQQTSVQNIFCAGESTGIGGVDLALIEGEIAGYVAAGELGRAQRLFRRRERARKFAASLNRAFSPREELKRLPKPDTIVCRCEDVTYRKLKDIGSFRVAKLHTRCGMGPCQGRICGPASEFLFGWGAESIRPPIFPARIESLILENSETEEITTLP